MHASASADEPASSASSASRALSRDPVPGIDPDGYPVVLGAPAIGARWPLRTKRSSRRQQRRAGHAARVTREGTQ